MSSYLNTYTPPPPARPLPPYPNLHTPPPLYDLNYLGCPTPHPLKTDKLALYPFVPSLYASQYHQELKALDDAFESGKGIVRASDLFRWMPYEDDVAGGLEGMLTNFEVTGRAVEGTLMFAIFDLTRINDPRNLSAHHGEFDLPNDHPPLNTFVGVLGLSNTDRWNLVAELGHVVILPKAQRTHVSSHAIALIAHYVLDHPYMWKYSPSERKFIAPQGPTSKRIAGGDNEHYDESSKAASPSPALPQLALGLRRLQWQSDHLNHPSINAALRAGFLPDALIRYQRVIPGLVENPGRLGDGEEKRGGSRTCWMGGISWRDWVEGGGRERVDELVGREK